MKIGYIGNFKPSHSTETHVAKSLRSLGHEVIEYQENDHTDRSLYRSIVGDSPALVLYTRTWGIQGDGMWLMKMLKRQGIVTVSYHLDLYLGLERGTLDKLQDDPFWHTQYVFTVDGDPVSAELFKKAGINHHYLRAGVFADEAYMAEPDLEKYPHEIIFVGSYGYHPEWPYRRRLIDWLQETYGERFWRYGHPETSMRGHELNVLYASAKVVVGDSLTPGFTHKNYWSDRVYETTGRGGFIIHPKVDGLETDFEDGTHIAMYDFDNFKQLKEIIEFALAREKWRKEVQLTGHLHTKENFTYAHRMRDLLAGVEAMEGRAL